MKFSMKEVKYIEVSLRYFAKMVTKWSAEITINKTKVLDDQL